MLVLTSEDKRDIDFIKEMLKIDFTGNTKDEFNRFIKINHPKAMETYMNIKQDKRNFIVSEILKRRNITRLYHFTKAANLKSIFLWGLCSRQTLERMDKEEKHNFYYNDASRYDGYSNSVSVSIEFPNYRMFYRLRQNNSYVIWAVLEIDADILCKSDCVFCTENASKKSVKRTKDLEELFSESFYYHDGWHSRNELHIEDRYPTNPQAEVLVLDDSKLLSFSHDRYLPVIPHEDIKCVWFATETDKNKYMSCVPFKVKVGVNPKLFSYREDYEFWKQTEL